MAFLTADQLKALGLKKLGKDVQISDRASLYNCANIEIGDNSRIDDFCILSAGAGGIRIGRHVHVACYVSLIGAGEIVLEDFCGVSSRTAVYSSNDDYSGEFMTGPTLPPEFTNVVSGTVNIGRHVVVGAGSILLPNVRLGEGAVVGALSLVNQDVEEFMMVGGVPAKPIKPRSRKLLDLEKQLGHRGGSD